MKIDIATTFVAAFALWRRDRALLVPLAGLFLFVPQLCVLLLVPEMPQPVPGDSTEEAARAWGEAFAAWASANGGWYLLAQLVALFGTLAIVTLYTDRNRPDVGAAMRSALTLLPRFVLAMILLTLPVGALLLASLPFRTFVYFVIVPIFYLLARALLLPPVLVAERPVGAMAAIARSWRLTRGNGGVLTAIYAALALSGPIVGSVFLGLLRVGGPNPVLVAIVSAAAAAAAAAAGLAQALVVAVVYARVASKGM